MDPYEELANAIVLRAVKDYRMAKSPDQKKKLEEFFLSDWYKVLTSLDGAMLLQKLKEEKQNER